MSDGSFIDPNLFQIVSGAGAVFGGWLLHIIWGEIKKLQEADAKQQEADEKLTAKIHEIDKLVAGNYVTRDYFEGKIDAMFRKLDEIVTTLNKKVDRHEQ